MTQFGLNVHWKQIVCCDATKLDCSLSDILFSPLLYYIPLIDVQSDFEY